ncbi:MAG TPA: Arc family DNA-binding protein [Devosia sp.]|jgi:hypothetical protein|nr:Arc family DNA-binding protein [Devosia sp.]
MTDDVRAWKDQYMLRLPDGMRERLKVLASDNKRSLNAEIVSRLDRYDSLGGEVDALWAVAGGLAGAIDEICAPTSNPLVTSVGDALASVDESGRFDRTKLAMDIGTEAARRIQSAIDAVVAAKDRELEEARRDFQDRLQAIYDKVDADLDKVSIPSGKRIPDGLYDRILKKAVENGRPASEEIIQALEKSYPPPRSIEDDEELAEWLENMASENNKSDPDTAGKMLIFAKKIRERVAERRATE